MTVRLVKAETLKVGDAIEITPGAGVFWEIIEICPSHRNPDDVTVSIAHGRHRFTFGPDEMIRVAR